MTAPAPALPDRRSLWAAYAIGLFGMGYIDIFVVLMPIYGGSLEMTATQIGTLVAARTVLTLIFSIHVGNLMDRLGTRRVMKTVVTVAMLCAPLYPLIDSFMALLVLQMIVGGSVAFGWAGGQTMIAQVAHGDAKYIGRFAFAARIGTAAAPLIAGLAWDLGGPWPAYLLGSVWGLILLATLHFAPDIPVKAGDKTTKARITPRDLLPRRSDYVRSFAMMAIPVIAITVVIMFLRNATSGINNSVYIVYMDSIGLSGWKIGLLFSAIEFASGFGSLMSGQAMRVGHPVWTMLIATALALGLICITPWLGGIFVLFLLAQVVRGLVQGVSDPVMFSVQSRTVGQHEQGAVVGLRQTMNRFSAIIVPPVMGAVADRWGLEESFLFMGAGLLLLCTAVGIWIARTPLRPVE